MIYRRRKRFTKGFSNLKIFFTKEKTKGKFIVIVKMILEFYKFISRSSQTPTNDLNPLNF
ncbi:hypothetical protein BPJM79_20413 [Bacillus pumilus]